MIDPVAKKLLAYFPEPNVPGDAGTNYNNYRKNVQSQPSAYQFDANGTTNSTTTTAWVFATAGCTT